LINMKRLPCLALVACLAACSPAAARSELPAGNYILYFSPNATIEQGLFFLKVERKGGKDVAEVIEPKDDAEIESVTVEDRKVLIVFKAFGRTLTFDGAIDAKDDKRVIGSFGDDALITRSRLVPTEKETLEQSERMRPSELPEPMRKAQILTAKAQALRIKIRQAKDDETRAELKKQQEEAQKLVDEQTPGLYREALEKHADGPVVIDALLALMPKAEKSVKPEEMAGWIKAADQFATPYGPRYRLETLSRILGPLGNLKGFEQVSLQAAEAATSALTDATPAGQQVKIFKALRLAQEKAGKPDLAKQTDEVLAKLEDRLDQEYLAKMPPFKPAKFQGRKEKSDRVAVLELFTGASCPPCVAADLAFDGLLKAYQPSDLVLVQYHMHIPQPDPLTNPSTIARWDYYKKLHPRGIGGVPTTLFNGKPQGGGGGGVGDAETKFKQFRAIIDPLLDEPTSVKLTGAAQRKGDVISIKAAAEGVPEMADPKIRLLLVEESIRYLGGNGVRFHHHVVRDMPGGPEGFPIKDGKGEASASVNLADLRVGLAKYLDDFVANEGAFSNPDRPLAFKRPRVIALVQDDATGEILQALQIDAGE
jgi:hypothetical protein